MVRFGNLALVASFAMLTTAIGCSKDKVAAAPACDGTHCAAAKGGTATNATTPGATDCAGCVGSSSSSSGASSSSSGGPMDPEWIPPAVATRSAACGGGTPQLTNAVYTTPGGRTFRVYAPSNYDANKPYPVSLTYHGWYADGAAFQGWFKMENIVGNAGLTVYPDARNGLWDLDGEVDLAFFDEMVKQLGDNYCINPARVLAFGFSFGGKFVNHLACKRAGHVKAMVVGDGSDGGPGQGCGRLPVLFVHRTHDGDELIDWARGARDGWARRMGCQANAEPGNMQFNCVVNNGCKSPASVQFCEDTWFDPMWPKDWNHTVRDEYKTYAWNWFLNLQ